MNKAILHDHLDGGLRANTALELAKAASYTPLLELDDVTKFFDRCFRKKYDSKISGCYTKYDIYCR